MVANTGQNILIVDDNGAIRRVTRSALERVGYTVHDAEDGEAAVALFQQESFEVDLVLLDLTLPGIDGEETFRQIRAIRPAVPVVMMSGYSEPEVTASYEGLTFLQKPFLPVELREAVAQALPPAQAATG